MKKFLAVIVVFAMLILQVPGAAFAADSDLRSAINELNKLTTEQRETFLGNLWDLTLKELNDSQPADKDEIVSGIKSQLSALGLNIISPASGVDGKISEASLEKIVQEMLDKKTTITGVYNSYSSVIDMAQIRAFLKVNTDGEALLKIIDASGPILTSNSSGSFIPNGNVVENALGTTLSNLFLSQEQIVKLNAEFKNLADMLNDYVAQYKVDKNDVIYALNIYGLYTAPSTGGDTPNPGSSGGSSTTPAPAPTPTVKEGTVQVKPVLDSNGTAKAAITQGVFDNAMKTASVGTDGVKTVVIKIDAVQGAKRYAPQLPASVVASDKKDVKIQIETPLGTLDVPANMFKKEDISGVSDLQPSIGLSNASGVKDADAAGQIGNRPVIELSVTAGGKAKAWSNPDAPVKLSVKYTPSSGETGSTDFLTIFYIDGAGAVVPVPNASFNSTTGTIDFSTVHFSKYAVAYVKKTFDDAGKYSWAKAAIEVAASRGIMGGASERTFDPDSDITRVEFLGGLVRTLGLSASFEGNFDDIKSGDKFYNEIGIAKKLGIMTGAGNNKFAPDTAISRQDMMVFISKAMKLAGKNSGAGSDSDLERFTDKSKIASYARDSVALLVKNKIIQGDGNILNPEGNFTRASSAVALYRLSKI